MLLFGVTPKEAIHTFTAHQDTIHRHDVAGPCLEKAHHHCQFLGFTLDAFSEGISLPRITPLVNEFVQPTDALSIVTVQRQIIATSLRGPPVA
jgi:hypothetical protein